MIELTKKFELRERRCIGCNKFFADETGRQVLCPDCLDARRDVLHSDIERMNRVIRGLRSYVKSKRKGRS